MPSLVAVFAHPDDEAYSVGGTLAAAVERGIDVTVVCATRGENGPSYDGTPRERLGEHRIQELRNACHALGVDDPVVLDLPDGELDENRAELAKRLEAFHADAVITMGPDGAYGHLDHVVCSEVVTNSMSGTILHVVYPDGIFDTLRKTLARTPIRLAPPVAVAPADFRVHLIRRMRERKLAAIAAHRSQLEDGDAEGFLESGLVNALLDEECFRRAAGPPLDPALVGLFEPL